MATHFMVEHEFVGSTKPSSSGTIVTTAEHSEHVGSSVRSHAIPSEPGTIAAEWAQHLSTSRQHQRRVTQDAEDSTTCIGMGGCEEARITVEIQETRVGDRLPFQRGRRRVFNRQAHTVTVRAGAQAELQKVAAPKSRLEHIRSE